MLNKILLTHWNNIVNGYEYLNNALKEIDKRNILTYLIFYA